MPRACLPVVVLWAAFGLAAGPPAGGGNPPRAPQSANGALGTQPIPVDRPDEDLLVLEVRLNRLTLHDGLIGYLHPGGVLLPLGEIAAALEFPISVEPGTGIAEGWFLAENRRFSLDLGQRQVLVEGSLGTFDAELAELHADDVYVDSTLLERWFPVAFDVDLSHLRITIEPREKLPIEQRLERRTKWSRLQRSPGSDGHRYPPLDLPYRFVAWPAIDNRLTLSWRGDERGRGDLAARYDALVAGDLLGMSAELSLGLSAGSRETPPNIRLKIGRRDPAGELLGPLRATEVSFGDLYDPRRPLVSHQQPGRGIEISNFPLGRPHEFDRTSLRGDAMPGWEVELYHNEGLIDFRVVEADGRYEFTDVPLYFGFNVLRLVFYGPQGQRREQVERLFIGPELIRADEGYYRVAILQHSDVAGADGAGEATPENPTSGPTEIDLHGQRRYFLEYERGLRRNLSIAMSLDSLPLEDGRHTYAGFRLRGTRKGFFGGVDLVADHRGGWAGRLTTQGRFFGVNLQLEHEERFDFVSEPTETTGGLLTSRSSLRVDGRVRSGRPGALTYRFTARREQRQPGETTATLSGRLSTSFRSVSFSNTLNLNLRRGEAERARGDRLDGSLLISKRRRRLRLRGALQYALRPQLRWTALTLTADWDLSRDFSTRVRVRQSFSDDLSNTYSAGINRRFAAFALGLNAGYDDRGRVSANLSLSYNLSREPRGGHWRSRSRSLATQGAASARVFLDNNVDGRFDDGDQPLEGVKIASNGGSQGRTDATGFALLTGLPVDGRVDLELAVGSLEDPYWVPQRQGVAVAARPGRVVAVDFPVVPSGEIDGTVRLRRGDELQTVSKVELQLLDGAGDIVQEVRSAFDGFYLFERVLPGRYTLRVNPDQLARLHLASPGEREITLGSGEVVSGVDLVITEASAS